MFCYESGLIYPIYVLNQKFKDCMDLLCISKILADLCAIKQKKKQKSFCKFCLQYFSGEKVLIEHKVNKSKHW